jgi:hypothetical protein
MIVNIHGVETVEAGAEVSNQAQDKLFLQIARLRCTVYTE